MHNHWFKKRFANQLLFKSKFTPPSGSIRATNLNLQISLVSLCEFTAIKSQMTSQNRLTFKKTTVIFEITFSNVK